MDHISERLCNPQLIHSRQSRLEFWVYLIYRLAPLQFSSQLPYRQLLDRKLRVFHPDEGMP